jgi:hypothetical protein
MEKVLQNLYFITTKKATNKFNQILDCIIFILFGCGAGARYII